MYNLYVMSHGEHSQIGFGRAHPFTSGRGTSMYSLGLTHIGSETANSGRNHEVGHVSASNALGPIYLGIIGLSYLSKVIQAVYLKLGPI